MKWCAVSSKRGMLFAICVMLGANAVAHGDIVDLSSLPVQSNRETGKIAPDQEKMPFLFVNKLWDGKPLAFGDKSYDTGLSAIHGSLSWSYELNGDYSGLVMDVMQEGTAIIRVLGDDKLLYDSGRLPQRSRVTAVVNVNGVKQLQFTIVDNEVGFWNDRVVIGNPKLIKRTLPDATDSHGKGDTQQPIAKIELTTTAGTAPLEMKFTGDGSKAPAGQVGRYTWTFGDGATETLSPNPSHTFAEPGVYEVVLQAEDDKGGVGVTRQLVTVQPGGPQPPTATPKASPRIAKVGESIEFDGSDSSSADGSISNYEWSFSDGATGEGKRVKHAFAAAGRYSVALTVTDKGIKSAKTPISIKVKGTDDAPVFPLQKGSRVLLIGNSLIGFCGPVDAWLMAFDKVSPKPLCLETAARGKGLGKLVEYATWSRLAVHDKIEEGWDVVIIQPWEDALDPKVSDEQLLHDCKTLVDWARDAGAFPVLYEPQFGWQDLDKEQARGHERISMLAEKLDTGFIPGGQAWLQVAKDLPMKKPGFQRSVKETDPETLDGLMYSDFGHQSFSGALFNSLMIWRYLTGEPLGELKLSATEKDVPDQAKRAVNWDKLPYLEKVAEQMIVPASQKVR